MNQFKKPETDITSDSFSAVDGIVERFTKNVVRCKHTNRSDFKKLAIELIPDIAELYLVQPGSIDKVVEQFPNEIRSIHYMLRRTLRLRDVDFNEIAPTQESRLDYLATAITVTDTINVPSTDHKNQIAIMKVYYMKEILRRYQL